MTNIYEVRETYTVVGDTAKDVEHRVVTSENQEFNDYTIQIIPKEYQYWLIELEIRDGGFEYLDRYIINVDTPRNEKDAWDKWTVEKTTTLDSKQMIEILHDDIKGESKIIDL